MGFEYGAGPVTRSKTTTSTGTSSHSTTTTNTSKTQETVQHELTDDGSGGFGALGTIDYASKTLNVRLTRQDSRTQGYASDYEDASAFESSSMSGNGGDPGSGSSSKKGGEHTDAAVSEEILAASTVRVTYATTFASATSVTESIAPPMVVIDLCPYTADYIVPGSVRFTWMGQVFEDYDGVLIRGRTANNPGIVAGQLDYSAGLAMITDYAVSGSADNFVLESLWTVRQNWTTASIFARTQAAPLAPGGFVMNLSDAQGNAITASADNSGLITGTHLRGRVDYETGVAELQFGDFIDAATLTDAQKAEWWYRAADVGAVQAGKIWRPWPVDPSTLRYNSVAYTYLPLDADILGLDPVRLPPDGRVPIFRVGSYVVLGHTASLPPAALSNGQVLEMGRTRLSRILVVGANGSLIQTGYTTNLDAGRLTVTDVSGWSQPVTVKHRIEEMARLADVQIDGTVRLTKQLSHAYPVGSVLSSALMAGDLRARVSRVFDQQSWNKVTWRDTVEGDEAAGTYNDTAYPITVTNDGALPERFALFFKTSTTFELYGEHVGLVGTGTTGVDFEPINPITSAPYLHVRYEGWGGGWVPGNVLFVHTEGAMAAFAAIRTVQPSEAAGTDYQFELLVRGNVDRP